MKDPKDTDRWVPIDPAWLEKLADTLSESKVPQFVKFADQCYDLLLWMQADANDKPFLAAAKKFTFGPYDSIEVDDNAAVLTVQGGAWVQAWVFVDNAEVDFPHGCPECEFKGYLYPMASDGDESREWIERCDMCQTYEDDFLAAAAMAQEGYDVRIAMHPRGVPQPCSPGKREVNGENQHGSS